MRHSRSLPDHHLGASRGRRRAQLRWHVGGRRTTKDTKFLEGDRMKSLSYQCLVVVLFSCLGAIAQQAAQPAAQTPASATPPSTGFAGLDRYRASRVAVYMNDYGQLARYREANTALEPAAAGENRVIFFGDSITDIWKINESFPGKPYINRGIGGQTTSQMLVRFRQDVIDLKPQAVVILAGTNDIAGNTGHISNENIEANLASLPDIARAHGIRFAFSTVHARN